MIRGWRRDYIQQAVERLDEVHFFMPPWAGTPEEALLITDYLQSITPPWPGGMAGSSLSLGNNHPTPEEVK